MESMGSLEFSNVRDTIKLVLICQESGIKFEAEKGCGWRGLYLTFENGYKRFGSLDEALAFVEGYSAGVK